MHKRSIRIVAVIAVVIVTALIGADRASAAGAVVISACQVLNNPNTTYKLNTDLTSCGDCLVVAVNKITIDLQGHSITSTCPGSGSGSAISDQATPLDGIVVKNGSFSGFAFGVFLQSSTRASVLGVTAKDNAQRGIVVGPQGLVKSSEASGNKVGIEVGPRGQVQQCNSHDNVFAGISTAFGDNCLITSNTASSNAEFGIIIDGNKCTISFNTARNNGQIGIDAGASVAGTGHLVTGNVALNNSIVDFGINCPSDVTNNDSTNGLPASYVLFGSGCHLVNNN